MTIGNSNPGVQPTYAFHVAKAYGKPGTQPVAPVQPRPATNAPTTNVPREGVIGGVGVSRAVTLPTTQPTPSPQAKTRIDQLVGATVAGKASPDFTGVQASYRAEVEGLRKSPSVLPMYTRPSDRNAVETVLLVGRTLDTRG